MPPEQILRRGAYGPTSPVVGPRGANTRQRIVAEALRQFELHGYYGTSVEGIATAMGISRPTLYQYFESKQQIFNELLEECGQDLARLVRRLGPLGPTQTGFDNLHWWIGEWAYIFDKYATVHVQWAVINSATNPRRPLVATFTSLFTERIASRLTSSGLAGVDPNAAANALINAVHWFNFYRRSGIVPPRPREALLDGLATCMQLMLFPDTPADALVAIIGSDQPPAENPEFPLFATLDSRPADSIRPSPEVGPRGAATRRRIMDAALQLFTERGYHETGVDDLLARLNLSRGTFYKYFPEKIYLLMELGVECGAKFDVMFDQLVKLDLSHDTRDQLRDWLVPFLREHRRSLGVIRTFASGQWTDPRLLPTAARSVRAEQEVLRTVLDRVTRNYPFDTSVASIVLIGMLDRLAESLLEVAPSEAEVAELMATLIDRAMFTPG